MRRVLPTLTVFALAALAGAQRAAKKVHDGPLHEDITHLKLSQPMKQRQKPIVADTVVRQTFTRELISFNWRSFDPISAYLIRPKGVARPKVAFFIYSYPQDAYKRFSDDDYCARLVKNGYAVLGLESAMTGERYRMRPMKEWFLSELREAMVCSVHDISEIIRYLDTRKDLDTKAFGFFGQGSGGAIGVLAASVEPRIKALDLLNPWGGWSDFLALSPLVPKEEFRTLTSAKHLASVKDVDPLAVLPKLSKVRVRIQMMEDDPVLPLKCRTRMMAAAPKNAAKATYPDNLSLMKATSEGKLFTWLGSSLAKE